MANHETFREQEVTPNRALRLTFSYDGPSVRLVSKQPVEMTLPPSHPLVPEEKESGFWFTLADKNNNPVYRRVIQNPIRLDKEVFSPESEKNIHRISGGKPRGSFVILVPDRDDARTLMMYSHPLEPRALFAPAREFLRFDLSAPPQGETKR